MPAFPPLPSVTVETGSGAALLVSDPAARGISLAIAHSASSTEAKGPNATAASQSA